MLFSVRDVFKQVKRWPTTTVTVFGHRFSKNRADYYIDYFLRRTFHSLRIHHFSFAFAHLRKFFLSLIQSTKYCQHVRLSAKFAHQRNFWLKIERLLNFFGILNFLLKQKLLLSFFFQQTQLVNRSFLKHK